MKPSWKTKLQQKVAEWLIRIRKIKHVDYTVDELNELIEPYFPQEFLVDVPVGKGTFTIVKADITIPRESQHIHIELACRLNIDSLGSPIYRANLRVNLLAAPNYDQQLKQVSLHGLDLDTIRIINDEYALLNDSKYMIDMVLPKGMRSLVTGTFKTAMGFMTVGSSDMASEYVKLYLTGSKQKVLDYHRPQIEKLIEDLKQDPDFIYQMDESDWQQKLFRRYGKTVVVEARCVRFKF